MVVVLVGEESGTLISCSFPFPVPALEMVRGTQASAAVARENELLRAQIDELHVQARSLSSVAETALQEAAGIGIDCLWDQKRVGEGGVAVDPNALPSTVSYTQGTRTRHAQHTHTHTHTHTHPLLADAARAGEGEAVLSERLDAMQAKWNATEQRLRDQIREQASDLLSKVSGGGVGGR